ncbi:MAG TPA: toll/interleukin-1 receptor domain-containing protein [Allosphingosinicella sp.]|nr:toll/interleukin-1 receptor domain-containing protein [Allosphingosinicella sp.]
MAGHVFISHGSENSDDADELCTFIESKGVKAWIAPRDVRPGIDYSEALQSAIENCSAFVVLVTDMANKSPYVRAETEMAFSSHKPIFPVRLTDISPGPGLAFFLKIRHWTDAYGKGREASLGRLALELQTLSGVLPAAPSPPPPPEPAPAPPLPDPGPAPPPPPPGGKAPAAPSAAPADADRLAAAIGPNASWYVERWRRMDARRSQVQWNWAACLASLAWFAYRKMWVPAAALALFFALLAALGLLTMSLPVAIGAGVLALAAMAASGALGTSFYRRHVGKLVAGAAGLDGEAAWARFQAKGGASGPAAFAGAALLAAIVAAVVVVLLLRQNAAPRPVSDDPFFEGATSGEGSDPGGERGNGDSTSSVGTTGTDRNVSVPTPTIEDPTANINIDELTNALDQLPAQLDQLPTQSTE